MTPASGRRLTVLGTLLFLTAGCGHADRAGSETADGVATGPESTGIGAETREPAVAGASGADFDRTLERAAYELTDLESGRVLANNRASQLDVPVRPGSIAKIVTLAAALEGGVVQRGTTVMCQRTLRVGTRILDCAHPVLPAPPAAVEALAQSCNSYFAVVGSRLKIADLSRMGVALGMGRYDETATPTLAAIGLEGIDVAPRRLPDVIVRLATEDGRIPGASTRRTVVAGLAAAALRGTASPLATAANDVLAKTGTTTAANGQTLGLVIAVWPAARPVRALVVVAPGGSGRDAAAVGAAVIRRATTQRASADSDVTVGRYLRGAVEIEHLPLAAYVAQVVAAEAPPDAPPALLETMAIAARTFAASHRRRHADEGFDLCDLTHCQAMAPATVRADAAVRDTTDMVLTWRHALASVFYSASCGGTLGNAADVWPDGSWPPYLSSRPDPGAHDASAWMTDVDEPALVRSLNRAGFRGTSIRAIRILRRSGDGRVGRVTVDGLVPDEASGEAFRLALGRTLGWQTIKSTWFDVERIATGYRFHGRGHGHGVGLCVAGAASQAHAGRSRDDILQAYFPGTAVESMGALLSGATRRSTPDERPTSSSPRPALDWFRLVLPSRDEAARQRLTRLVGSALAEMGRASGLSPSSTITVRVHPTVQSYQRATGLPWWTRGATRGATIDLIPLETLDERHELDETVRHELAHVLTATALEGRARWVKEGAAMYFSRGRSAEATSSRRPFPGAAATDGDGCPSDGEFRKAGSAGDLQQIYLRADRCFRDALAAGTEWSDVK